VLVGEAFLDEISESNRRVVVDVDLVLPKNLSSDKLRRIGPGSRSSNTLQGLTILIFVSPEKLANEHLAVLSSARAQDVRLEIGQRGRLISGRDRLWCLLRLGV
jgi:hypothetical protein